MARRAVAATSTLLLALVAGPALAASQAPQGVPARTQATRTTAAIRVDGCLDEDAWQHAQQFGLAIAHTTVLQIGETVVK